MSSATADIDTDRLLTRGWPLARPVPESWRGAVLVIGNFDGVHRGHRALLEQGRALADERGAPLVALTFDPHPRRFFQPDAAHFALSSVQQKADQLIAAGADGVLALRFDAALAGLSAEAFIDELLLASLQACGVVVGHDFRFGHGRAGDAALLRQRLETHGLRVIILPPVSEGGEIVSSRSIRAALEEGDIARANRLLGHAWAVRALVEHGDKRGRDLGFPTANLHLPRQCLLRHGIYAVRALVDGVRHDGVASFGRRPTFDDGAPKLEVFLFDFSGDLYGREIEVSFHGWIRGEAKFDSIEALITQMKHDCEAAKRLLEAAP